MPGWRTSRSIVCAAGCMYCTGIACPPRRLGSCLWGPRAGWQHDFPSHFEPFIATTSGQRGNAKSICRERTVLKFYRRFIADDTEAEVCATMQRGPVVHLKYKLGLLTCRSMAHQPLKACPACVASDLDEDGWWYWHLRHQIPGCWVCTSHGVPLIEVAIEANGVQRFGWCLPTPRLLTWSSTAGTRLDHSTVSALIRFADLGEQLVASPPDYRLVCAQVDFRQGEPASRCARTNRFWYVPAARIQGWL